MPLTDLGGHVSFLHLLCPSILKVYSHFANLLCAFFLAATNVNQGHDIITPQVHVTDINQALAFNGQGTHLVGQARAAQVLHSYRASYGGFIDRRT